jgi:hypothetical protein
VAVVEEEGVLVVEMVVEEEVEVVLQEVEDSVV